jgi:hypothetical protein
MAEIPGRRPVDPRNPEQAEAEILALQLASSIAEGPLSYTQRVRVAQVFICNLFHLPSPPISWHPTALSISWIASGGFTRLELLANTLFELPYEAYANLPDY